MFKLKLGTDNSWKSQEGGGFRQRYDHSYNQISISCNETGDCQYDVCVKIDSLSSRSNKLVEYGELFVCLANKDIKRYSRTKNTITYYKSNTEYYPGLDCYLQKIIRGKNEYHFNINGDKYHPFSYKICKAIDYRGVDAYVDIIGRILRLPNSHQNSNSNFSKDKNDNDWFKQSCSPAHIVPGDAVAQTETIRLHINF
jgi:hypothetical protein